MYSVSLLYRQIIVAEPHWFEWKVAINGNDVEQSGLTDVSTAYLMFSESQPAVGGCLAGELSVSLLNPAFTIPRMALVEPYIRVTNGTQTSEWIPQGKFYIDTRETTNNDDDLPILSLHCYDAMLKAEADYPSTTHDWPYADTEVVQEIATTLGVGVDDRTWDLMTQNYQILLPAGYSMREVLSNIAGMYAANWIMNYDGELLLVAVNGIPPETNYLIDSIGDAITFGGDRILV